MEKLTMIYMSSSYMYFIKVKHPKENESSVVIRLIAPKSLHKHQSSVKGLDMGYARISSHMLRQCKKFKTIQEFVTYLLQMRCQSYD